MIEGCASDRGKEDDGTYGRVKMKERFFLQFRVAWGLGDERIPTRNRKSKLGNDRVTRVTGPFPIKPHSDSLGCGYDPTTDVPQHRLC